MNSRERKGAILQSVTGGLTEAINDAGFVEVVGRHFDFDAVSDGQADESLPHLAGNVSEHHVAVVQLDAEHGSCQDCFDFAF